MNDYKSRRSFLRSGVMAGAGAALATGLGARAFAQMTDQGQGSGWGFGAPQGQRLPPEATNGPWKKLRAVQAKKVFDMHVHCYETPKQGHNYATEGAEHVRDVWTNYVNELIASMDRHGIAQAALNPAFTTFEIVYKEAYLAHKDRFILSGGMPNERFKNAAVPDPTVQLTPQALADIYEEQITRYGARFIGESAGNMINRRLMPKYSLKELKPVVDVLLKHDVPVQIHTGWTPTGTSINYGTSYQTADEWAATLGKFMSAYPEVKVILAHEGGQLGQLDGWQAIRLLYSFDNAYCDTAKSPPDIITAAVKGIGAERVMFGSDWNRPQLKEYGPFYMRDTYQQWWNLNNIAMADITEEQRDWVLYKSAHKLLKLSAAT
jgi:predicted TIM-barrel fold metal-dependent hydrolase